MKLLMPEVVRFLVLSRNVFPCLSPVKGCELLVETTVFELLVVKAMNKTFVSCTLVYVAITLLYLFFRRSRINLLIKIDESKADESKTFQTRSCPCCMGPASMKYVLEMDEKFWRQNGWCLKNHALFNFFDKLWDPIFISLIPHLRGCWKLASFLRASERYCAVIVILLVNKQTQIYLLISERTSLWVILIFIKYRGANFHTFHFKILSISKWMDRTVGCMCVKVKTKHFVAFNCKTFLRDSCSTYDYYPPVLRLW